MDALIPAQGEMDKEEERRKETFKWFTNGTYDSIFAFVHLSSILPTSKWKHFLLVLKLQWIPKLPSKISFLVGDKSRKQLPLDALKKPRKRCRAEVTANLPDAKEVM